MGKTDYFSKGRKEMKKVFYTQRVEMVESYRERRDCADQNIPRFLQACGFLPFPIPNVIENIDNYLEKAEPEGILLTGGNSLSGYGGNAPERDKTDEHMIRWAIEKKIPVYGFCRGMQSILVYFGNELENVVGHVAVRHDVNGEINRNVNSYHNQACVKLKEECGLVCMARTEDGVIEAVRHTAYPIMGTMWHPEREEGFDKADIQMLRNLFSGE